MNIYIHKDDQQLGPFDEAQIKDGLWTGEFTIDDFAWKEGLQDWVRLRDLLNEEQKTPQVHKNPLENKNSIQGEQKSNQASGKSVSFVYFFACFLILAFIYFAVKASAPKENTKKSEEDHYYDIITDVISSASDCQLRISSLISRWDSALKHEYPLDINSWHNDTYADLEKINIEKPKIQKKMMSASNLSSKNENIHMHVFELFNAYNQLCNLAKEPSDDFLTYRSNYSEAKKKIAESLLKIKYSPDLSFDKKDFIDYWEGLKLN